MRTCSQQLRLRPSSAYDDALSYSCIMMNLGLLQLLLLLSIVHTVLLICSAAAAHEHATERLRDSALLHKMSVKHLDALNQQGDVKPWLIFLLCGCDADHAFDIERVEQLLQGWGEGRGLRESFYWMWSSPAEWVLRLPPSVHYGVNPRFPSMLIDNMRDDYGRDVGDGRQIFFPARTSPPWRWWATNSSGPRAEDVLDFARDFLHGKLLPTIRSEPHGPGTVKLSRSSLSLSLSLLPCMCAISYTLNFCFVAIP